MIFPKSFVGKGGWRLAVFAGDVVVSEYASFLTAKYTFLLIQYPAKRSSLTDDLVTNSDRGC
jgi:hypothetical protein